MTNDEQNNSNNAQGSNADLSQRHVLFKVPKVSESADATVRIIALVLVLLFASFVISGVYLFKRSQQSFSHETCVVSRISIYPAPEWVHQYEKKGPDRDTKPPVKIKFQSVPVNCNDVKGLLVD